MEAFAVRAVLGCDARMYSVAETIGRNPIVIVGGGIAAGNAAVTLREEGFAGPVVIISQEPGVPFGRPPLSKTYLRSEEDLEGWYVRPAGWYDEHGVDRRGEIQRRGRRSAAHRSSWPRARSSGTRRS